MFQTRAIIGLRPDPREYLLQSIGAIRHASYCPHFGDSPGRVGADVVPRQLRAAIADDEGQARAYSTIISPFMTIQWPGNVQR